MNNGANEPAFPTYSPNYEGRCSSTGLTVRDYFAAKALQGIISEGGYGLGLLEDAKMAYKYADAMLEARDST